jgi:hypothetical protein
VEQFYFVLPPKMSDIMPINSLPFIIKVYTEVIRPLVTGSSAGATSEN